jgi:predicted kinase
LVLVTGAPGSGKTTLAGALAAELGFPLLAKDRIKETLYDSLGASNASGAAAELAWSQRLGMAVIELLWALASDAPAVVIDANFWPDERHQHRIRELAARAAEVHCACPAEVAMSRYVSRRGRRHPTLAETARNPSPDSFARCNQPLRVGAFIAVDATAPVDVGELSHQVRARLGLRRRRADFMIEQLFVRVVRPVAPFGLAQRPEGVGR